MNIEDESVDQLLERAQLVLNDNENLVSSQRSTTDTIAAENSSQGSTNSIINNCMVESMVSSTLNEAQAVLDSVSSMRNAASTVNGI